MTKPLYTIDTTLDIDYQDSGPWRSYQLHGSGSNWGEVHSSLYIEEVDQDGGTLNTYPLIESTNEVCEKALQHLSDKMTEEYNKVQSVLHPYTKKLSIKAKLIIGENINAGLYGVLMELYQQGFDFIERKDLIEIHTYMRRIKEAGQ